MIRINLLPHREAFRQQQILEYITVFVAGIFAVLMVIIFLDVLAESELASLSEETKALASQNAVLVKQIGEIRNLDKLRKNVESKLQIVDELQAGRFRALETLNAIAKAIPESIWLESLNTKGTNLSFEGFGESSQAIANFMRRLESSELFSNVRLTVDQQDEVDGVAVRKFGLSLHRLTLVEQAALKKAEQEKEVKQ